VQEKSLNSNKDDTLGLSEEEIAEVKQLDDALNEENPDLIHELSDINSQDIQNVALEFEHESKKSKLKEKLTVILFKAWMQTRIWSLNLFYFLKSKVKSGSSLAALEIKNKLNHGLSKITKLTTKQKIVFVLILIFALSVPFSIQVLLNWVKFASVKTITDLSILADNRFEMTEDEKFESYFNSKRTPVNLLLFKTIVTNIKPSENSSPNPMFAGELFFEAINPHVLAEIKAKEAFFVDLIRTFTESWDYDELSTQQGKKLYLDELKKEVQKHLSKGLLSAILFKSLIIKP